MSDLCCGGDDGVDGVRAQWSTDVEVPLVLMVVLSMVSVDGGLGTSTQGALTWKSLFFFPAVTVTRTVVALLLV